MKNIFRRLNELDGLSQTKVTKIEAKDFEELKQNVEEMIAFENHEKFMQLMLWTAGAAFALMGVLKSAPALGYL